MASDSEHHIIPFVESSSIFSHSLSVLLQASQSFQIYSDLAQINAENEGKKANSDKINQMQKGIKTSSWPKTPLKRERLRV